MRLYFLLCIIVLSWTSIQAQRIHEIKIGKSDHPLNQYSYYIEKVEDGREDTSSIGVIKKGPNKAEFKVKLKDGVERTVYDYFNTHLPQANDIKPLTLRIIKFKISEIKKESETLATFELKVELYENEKLLSTEHLITYKRGENCRPYHASNIELGLRNLIIQFAAGYHSNKIHKYENSEEINIKNSSPRTGYYKSRTLAAIGYGIGGWSLLGIDITIRLNDVFGFHFGVGALGYTGGFKFHFNKDKNSDFVNLSFKNGGFGLVNTANLEYGGHIPFSITSDFGLFGQLGIGYILSIDSGFSRFVFKSNYNTKVVLSFGLGFSF